MKPNTFFFWLSLAFIVVTHVVQAKDPKIVGLVPARNEELIIEQCLRALACYTDAIVVLDDASEDRTLEIIKSLKEECNIERIITKEVWLRDEPGDRNKLLQAGREIGGTHFIALDADEILTAPCAQNNYLRNRIIHLKPGDKIKVAMLRLWGSLDHYIDDMDALTPIFCDDGVCRHDETRFIHTSRIPKSLSGITHLLEDFPRYGLMHMQSANINNMRIRNYWYKCLEFLRKSGSAERINTVYRFSADAPGKLAPALPEWFAYDLFDKTVFTQEERGRKQQVLAWFDEHGKDYFADLGIWDVEWVLPKVTPSRNKQAKIVGLVPIKNEENMIENCLRALACYTDAIVVLDDVSEDRTLEIVESLKDECNIEKIIKKKVWFRDEPGDRNKLLQTGRALGGTHFVVIDADEMFTANCVENNYLRNKILELQPGDQLRIHWIRLWRTIDVLRRDNAVYKECIFCDDEKCWYESGFIHTKRIPDSLKAGELKTITDHASYGLLHFQSVNWENIRIRKAWYQCLELIREPRYTPDSINRVYQDMINEEKLQLLDCPSAWYDGYGFFDKEAPAKLETWKKKQMLQWFQEYGRDYFADLDIWDIHFSS